MASSSGKPLTEIPVMVEGTQKWVTGLTPKTTCDDIIHSLLISMNNPTPHEAVMEYSLFQTTNGTDQQLKGRSKVLKVLKEKNGINNGPALFTMRKTNCSIYSTLSKSKGKSKRWFNFKDMCRSKSKSKSLFSAISVSDTSNTFEDSSIMIQNRDNNLLSCAFACSVSNKKHHKGHNQSNNTLTRPFERPRSVMLPNEVNVYSGQFQRSELTNGRSSLKNNKRHSVSYSTSSLHANFAKGLSSRKCNSSSDLKSHQQRAAGSSAIIEENCNDTYDELNSLQVQYSSGQDIYMNRSDSLGGCNELSNLTKRVMIQDRQIQEQFVRIKEADKKIEDFEISMHHLRSKSQGKDYLQDTYLNSFDIQDNDIDTYENLVESIASIDERLFQQYHKLEDLSSLLHLQSQSLDESFSGIGPLESTRMIDPAIQNQIDILRGQLQNSVEIGIKREKEIKDIEHCIMEVSEQIRAGEGTLEILTRGLELEYQNNNPHVSVGESSSFNSQSSVLSIKSNSTTSLNNEDTLSSSVNSTCSDLISSNKELCHDTTDIVLPQLGLETMSKLFSKKLMPDFGFVELTPSLQHNASIRSHLSDATSVWNSLADDGIDVTFKEQHDEHNNEERHSIHSVSYCQSPNSLLGNTFVSQSNTLLDSTINVESPSYQYQCHHPTRSVHTNMEVTSVKKKLMYEYNCNEVVDREIKGVLSTITGDVSRLSESSESGMGSFNSSDYSSDDSSEVTRSWRCIETEI